MWRGWAFFQDPVQALAAGLTLKFTSFSALLTGVSDGLARCRKEMLSVWSRFFCTLLPLSRNFSRSFWDVAHVAALVACSCCGASFHSFERVTTRQKCSVCVQFCGVRAPVGRGSPLPRLQISACCARVKFLKTSAFAPRPRCSCYTSSRHWIALDAWRGALAWWRTLVKVGVYFDVVPRFLLCAKEIGTVGHTSELKIRWCLPNKH